MKRVVTYDVKQGNDYSRFYDFIKEAKAEQITESTYLFDTQLVQSDFEKKLRWAFNKGDNVNYISVNNESELFFIKLKMQVK